MVELELEMKEEKVTSKITCTSPMNIVENLECMKINTNTHNLPRWIDDYVWKSSVVPHEDLLSLISNPPSLV